MLDQPHNAKILVSLGVAPCIVPYKSMNAKNLSKAIAKILSNDKGIRETAERIKSFVMQESEGNGTKYCEVVETAHEEQRRVSNK